MFGPEDIWLVSGGFLALFIAIVLYMMGGTTPWKKFLRRYVGAFVLASSTNVIMLVKQCWDWHALLIYVGLAVAFSLPYGSDTFWGKLSQRAVFAIGVVSAGVFGAWAMGWPAFGWGILGLQLIVGLGSVYLGVRNPYKNAPLEQGMICLLLTFTIPFWGFVG